jgi:hypothetical protein
MMQLNNARHLPRSLSDLNLPQCNQETTSTLRILHLLQILYCRRVTARWSWVRFDIAYAVSQLARFCASAGPVHHAALHHGLGMQCSVMRRCHDGVSASHHNSAI